MSPYRFNDSSPRMRREAVPGRMRQRALRHLCALSRSIPSAPQSSIASRLTFGLSAIMWALALAAGH
eukprot:scaffold173037_cov30-Tisochrysis_lutea.AAC.8